MPRKAAFVAESYTALDSDPLQSTVPSVNPEIFSQAVLAILELEEKATLHQRAQVMASVVDVYGGANFTDTLIVALDIRIAALCRMNRSPVFRALLSAHSDHPIGHAILLASSFPVQMPSEGVFEFRETEFNSELLARLEAPAS